MAAAKCFGGRQLLTAPLAARCALQVVLSSSSPSTGELERRASKVIEPVAAFLKILPADPKWLA